MRARDAWRRHAGRIDAMSLRERGFLFACVAFLLVALADVLVLTPYGSERKALAATLAKQQDELAAMRTRLTSTAKASGPGNALAGLRRDIESARALQEATEERIAHLGERPGDAGGLQAVLERLLARHDRLVLVKLATAAEATAPTSTATTAATALRWQGIDLAVKGSYPDLVTYLAELEQALPGLRWDKLKLSGGTGPSTLGVRLYLPALSTPAAP